MSALVLGLAATGCKNKTKPPQAREANAPARRAAVSFVHCVELEGAGCVGFDEDQAAWDAFSILGWLASGSPTSILSALQQELYHHSDPRLIQSRFVTQVERHAQALRGAECKTVLATDDASQERVVLSFSQLIPQLREAVERRLTTMGIWREDMRRVVDGLTEEASRGLSDGFLVVMRCEAAPHSLYIATATMTDSDGFVAVGMLTSLPEFLGGSSAARDTRTNTLAPISLGPDGSAGFGAASDGNVHPWVSVPVEEF